MFVLPIRYYREKYWEEQTYIYGYNKEIDFINTRPAIALFQRRIQKRKSLVNSGILFLNSLIEPARRHLPNWVYRVSISISAQLPRSPQCTQIGGDLGQLRQRKGVKAKKRGGDGLLYILI